MTETHQPLSAALGGDRILAGFLQKEALAGLILIAAAALALILANSAYGSAYLHFLEVPGAVVIGPLAIAKPLHFWVNDLWMAVFFFVIGLEVKREFLEGAFTSRASLLLPLGAALGGMAAPALIYAAVNHGNAQTIHGWAIPAATDIAFALGIISLLGNRAPPSLKILLTAIAVIDDLGAIVIIALFYTSALSALSLALAALAIAGLVLLNRLRVTQIIPYLLIGGILWTCVLKSGVHATLAGVITAFAIPNASGKEDGHSPLKTLEHALHPWVAFLILPVFAFVNAGVVFGGIGPRSFLEPVTLGILLGLFLGKQLGVFLPLLALIRLGAAEPPEGASWLQIYGLAVLCGIGFTMSLFLGGLAFPPATFDAQLRLGVLGGSVLSATLGYLLLRAAPYSGNSAG